MADATVDTLGLARRLRDRAGFSPDHAEEAAQAIAEFLSPQLATKTDLAILRTDLAILRTDFAELKGELTTDVAELKGELTRLILTVATGQVALLLAAMFSLARFTR